MLSPVFQFQKNRRFNGGFTLIELMAVLCIIAIMAVMTLPALQGTLSGINLKGCANNVTAELELARQTASTRNLSVDLRLYQDTSKSKDSNGNYPYRILAIVIPASVSGAASDEFITQPLFLSSDVIFDSNTQYSSMLNPSLGAAGLRPVASTEFSSAPGPIKNLPYIKFTYLANGTINLDSSQQWCLTLVNGNKTQVAATTNGPTADFVSFVFDVQTSRARSYQP